MTTKTVVIQGCFGRVNQLLKPDFHPISLPFSYLLQFRLWNINCSTWNISCNMLINIGLTCFVVQSGCLLGEHVPLLGEVDGERRVFVMPLQGSPVSFHVLLSMTSC